MKKIRQQRGLSTRIAEGLGISPAAVHAWQEIPTCYVREVGEITKLPLRLLKAGRDPWSRNNGKRVAGARQRRRAC
jgi:hypothetical protein